MKQSIVSFALGLLLWCAAQPTALAGDVGSVAGGLRFKGDTVALDHVLVVRYGNEEGTAQGAHLRVFLSDHEVPLALSSTVSLFSLRQALHRAGANAVLLRADADGRGRGAAVELLAAKDLPWPMVESVTAPDAFGDLTLGARRLSGEVTLRQGDLEVKARFDAPVLEYAVTDLRRGKAARTAAPARALIACTVAARRGDLDALAECFSNVDAKELERYRAQVGAKAFARQSPSPTAYARSIRRVVVRGDTATVQAGGEFIEMERVGGRWKIGG